MKRFFKHLPLASALLAVCSSASATSIAAGGSVAATPLLTNPTQYLARIDGGTFISQAPAGIAPTIQGTYSTSVYKDSLNTLCSVAGGCVTFAIQVFSSKASTDGIETVTTGPFSNAFTYNVGYTAGSGTEAPLIISDSATGTISFRFVNGTNWANMLLPGQSSDVLLIQTSATNYINGSISIQDTQTATVPGFIAATPEPSSLLLLGSGLVGTAATALRRRHSAA